MLAGLSAAPVHAGWDNVFQVTCWGCKKQPAVSAYVAAPAPTVACAPPCQQTCCTTQYVQRSYYQPVTCYQAQSYYEPVTSYKTSYYYEPVTSYRYSCYYDPCTCSYQQVACPQTCYRLRSQTCAVTSYLQRTCQVPVTSYQLSYYYEPVTTCTQTPCCPTPCSPCASAAPAVVEQPSVAVPAVPAQPAVPAVPVQPSTPPPPAVKEQPSIPPTSSNKPPEVQRIYPQPSNPVTPAQPQNSYRPAPATAPPVVKLDRIVSIPANSTGNRLQGTVVRNDDKPRPGAQMMFVNERKQGSQLPVTADKTGQFNVELAAGPWLVYVAGNDGRMLYHSKVEVHEESNKPVVLVSR
jgi:hypothetical protein